MNEVIMYPGRESKPEPVRNQATKNVVQPEGFESFDSIEDVLSGRGITGLDGGGVEQTADGTVVGEEEVSTTDAENSEAAEVPGMENTGMPANPRKKQGMQATPPPEPELPPRSLAQIEEFIKSIAPGCAADVAEYLAEIFEKNPDPKQQVKMIAEYTYAELLAWARKMRCKEPFSAALKREIVDAARDVLLPQYQATNNDAAIDAIAEYVAEQYAALG